MLPAFAAKMSMLTMATFTNGNILAWLHVPHGFPRCDVFQKKKKKYLNRYYCHTFCCKLKTGP